jgi:NADH:ubiquinone reductase (H+-translocating)
MGVRVKGFPVWAIGHFYHVGLDPGIGRKIRLIADWTVDFWFRRDTSELGELGATGSLEEHVRPARLADRQIPASRIADPSRADP